MIYLPAHIPSDSGFADSAFGFGSGIKKSTEITFCGFLYSQKLQDTKCDTADLYKNFYGLNFFNDLSLCFEVCHFLQCIRCFLFLEVVQLFKVFCPEMITECPCLLFHLAKAVLYAEPPGIQLYDLYCRQGKICTDQDTSLAVIFHKHKPELLIEFLAPEQIHAFVSDRLVPSIYRNKGFRKGIRSFV